MTIGAGVSVFDIPPGPPPTSAEEPEQPVPVPTVAQPGSTPAAGTSWSAGEITIALIVVVALVAAVVALSVYVARRPA